MVVSRLAGASLSILLVYFAYHAFAGEQGLGKWRDMQRDAENLRVELEKIENEILEIESRLSRLEGGTLDEDFVEALIHDRLIYAYPGEIVLVR